MIIGRTVLRSEAKRLFQAPGPGFQLLPVARSPQLRVRSVDSLPSQCGLPPFVLRSLALLLSLGLQPLGCILSLFDLLLQLTGQSPGSVGLLLRFPGRLHDRVRLWSLTVGAVVSQDSQYQSETSQGISAWGNRQLSGASNRAVLKRPSHASAVTKASVVVQAADGSISKRRRVFTHAAVHSASAMRSRLLMRPLLS